jgi:hypothetical protein
MRKLAFKFLSKKRLILSLCLKNKEIKKVLTVGESKDILVCQLSQ